MLMSSNVAVYANRTDTTPSGVDEDALIHAEDSLV
jgi:hypothetical protein